MPGNVSGMKQEVGDFPGIFSQFINSLTGSFKEPLVDIKVTRR